MIDPDAALSFLTFVEERHHAWEARQAGLEQELWTTDPIVRTRKFTNIFRWLDPGSQFVITDLLEDLDQPEEFLFRCFLYRHTNLPEAWRAVRADLGEYPTLNNIEEARKVFHDIKRAGGRIFSGAYMIYPQSATPGTSKIDSVIDLAKRVIPEIVPAFVRARGQATKFDLLRGNKGVADFMSMQILTDYGYATEFRENEFVIPGPGAVKGAKALSTTMKPREVLEWAFAAVHAMPQVPEVDLGNGFVVLPSKMDIQNCLCEFSKYVRYSDRPSPSKPYSPAHPGVQLPPTYPPLW